MGFKTTAAITMGWIRGCVRKPIGSDKQLGIGMGAVKPNKLNTPCNMLGSTVVTDVVVVAGVVVVVVVVEDVVGSRQRS